MRRRSATTSVTRLVRGWSAGTAALLAVAAAAASVAACTAFEEIGAKEPSRTGGVTLSLSILRTAEQSYELFRVTRAGDLEYGGGLRAFNGSTNWSGAMTDEEIRAFLAAIDRSGWCSEPPLSDSGSATRCRIEIRCPESRHTWEIRGEPESVVEMRALLDPIARRRLSPELDRLPEASERRTMTRGAPSPADQSAPRDTAPEGAEGVPPGSESP